MDNAIASLPVEQFESPQMFQSPPYSEWLCGICQEVPVPPVVLDQTGCQHIFCSKCILRAHQRKNACPTCRRDVRRNQIKESEMLFRTAIGRLKATCPKGCEWKGELFDWTTHCSQCPNMEEERAASVVQEHGHMHFDIDDDDLLFDFPSLAGVSAIEPMVLQQAVNNAMHSFPAGSVVMIDIDVPFPAHAHYHPADGMHAHAHLHPHLHPNVHPSLGFPGPLSHPSSGCPYLASRSAYAPSQAGSMQAWSEPTATTTTTTTTTQPPLVPTANNVPSLLHTPHHHHHHHHHQHNPQAFHYPPMQHNQPRNHFEHHLEHQHQHRYQPQHQHQHQHHHHSAYPPQLSHNNRRRHNHATTATATATATTPATPANTNASNNGGPMLRHHHHPRRRGGGRGGGGAGNEQ